MTHIKDFVPHPKFAGAMAHVLLGTRKPTAATKEKLADFMQKASDPGVKAGKSADIIEEESEEESAPKPKHTSKNPPLSTLTSGPTLLGAGLRKKGGGGLASGPGKLNMGSMLTNSALLSKVKDDDDDDDDDDGFSLASGSTATSNRTGGSSIRSSKPFNFKSLLGGSQWKSSTPVESGQGEEDDFDF